MGTRVFGKPIRRSEDERLLRGAGAFVDDIDLPGQLHASFVRSPVARARLAGVDVDRARAAPGVRAVYTHEDVAAINGPALCLFAMQGDPDERFAHKSMPSPETQRPLATDHLYCVGQTVAMVVAESRALAEDAAELVIPDYEELPAVIDLEAALDADAPLVHESRPSNLAGQVTQVVGDPDAAFRDAEVTVSARYVLERSAAMPMETRGILARHDRDGTLTIWDNTQVPIPLKRILTFLLSLEEEKVRVITTDSGGGFGVKAPIPYPEELLVCWATMQLGQPVKWIEDRQEHFVASNHERKQIHDIELAASADGVITGVRDTFLNDVGAFIEYGMTSPLNSSSQVAGQYRIPNIYVDMKTVYTNTMRNSPYRGAGRSQVTFALERAVERLARELEIDPAEIRRRNLIRHDEFPYRREGLHTVDAFTVEMDSGNYEEQLDRLLEAIGYTSFPEEQRQARDEGRQIGIGLGLYIESTGLGPYEGALVRVQPSSGKVFVATGVTTQGQGHHTTFAQIAAEELGVDVADVVLVEGDTDAFPWGVGTYASRAAVNSGNAIAAAAVKVREKTLKLASNMLEAAPEDLEIKDGRVGIRGSSERSLSLKQVATACSPDRYAFDPETAQLAEFGPPRPAGGPLLLDGDSPGLEASAYYTPENGPTWASGAHAAVVEVDVETGVVTYLRYAVVHDCGVLINPMIVDGQVMGGVAQGVGGALYERMAYDETGQLRNASLMDFLVPYATEIPPMTVGHVESPSPYNQLGIKGAGEAGCIPVPAVTAAAIDNAVGYRGREIDRMPLDPHEIVAYVGTTATD